MRNKFSYIVSAIICLSSCEASLTVQEPSSGDSAPGPVEVRLSAGGSFSPQLKTSADEDGLGTSWVAGDRIAVWALDSGGREVLSATGFSLYGASSSKAFFSATLDSAMPEGEYTYYATYPEPSSVSGTSAVFSVSSLQDGHSGGGVDIMLSAPETGDALKPVEWESYDGDEVSLSMDHMLHRLRFYCPEACLPAGEKISRVVAAFPRPVAGDVTLNVVSGELTASGSGSQVITLEPAQAVPLSGSTKNYVTASVIPVTFSPGESMQVTFYTDTKVARMTVPLGGRTFAPGHSTAVRMTPETVGNCYRIAVRMDSNNLGEDIQSMTLSAPEGCRWGDSLGNELVYSPGRTFTRGENFILEFEDEAAFMSLSGKKVTVTYDSEHARISEEISIGSLSGKYSADLSLNVPYLLYEDFSSVGTFSYDDEYTGGFNSGSKSPHSFLDGWTGARVGAQAGQCIRIACRRETSANYSARVDSAPLKGILKSPVDLDVEFDYGANNQYGGLIIITDPNVGQTCFVGYVTSSEGYKSGDTSGTFESGNSFYVKEYSGSYTSTPNKASYTIHGAPAGGIFRLTLRTEIESQAGTNNTTDWLYIDNVKIKIKG